VAFKASRKSFDGWAEFFPNDEAGTADLPIVDAVIAEVFARSNASRCSPEHLILTAHGSQ
jgi:hypothetical protein